MSNEVDPEYLFRIVHLGDSQEFLDILERNVAVNINIQNDTGESLLIHCVKRLEAKWTAAFGGEFRTICKILINRNIDVNLRDVSGKTAANYAAEYQQLEVLRLLIQKGAYLDDAVLDSVIDKEDWILALCASLVKESDLKAEGEDDSSTLVNRGKQVKLKLFHRLLASNYLSSINWMCELFPEIIEKKNEESLTALHIAVIEDNVEALKVLLRSNADLEAVDSKRHTALHFAVEYGHMDCMRTLLESGSHINCQDVSGATPLHYAINAGSKKDDSSDKVLKYLLERGADTTFADTYGRLALHWASNAGNARVCAMMVEHGSPVNARCNDGHTALHIAASQGHAECIRVLVMKCGADINMEDNYGYTPLFNAISKRHIHCAELLLYQDASPNHCNNTQGISPAHLAASEGLTEALEVLVKYQGSLELRNNEGDLPIHEAALFKHQDAVNYIIRCQCKVNVRNNKGFTPLHLAASAGTINVCECLLEGGADMNCINVQSKNGIYKYVTPLDLAQLNKHPDCVRYLQGNSGFRGNEMVKFAARKIQSWWRKHRPPRIVLEPIQEYDDDCLEEINGTLEIKERAFADGTNCLTKTQNTTERNDKISEQKRDNTKEIRVQNTKPNRSSSNSKNHAQTLQKRSNKVLADLQRPTAKISPVNKTGISSEKHMRSVKTPSGESPKNQPNITVKETKHTVKTSPRYNRKPCPTLKKQAEEKTNEQDTSRVATSKQQKSKTLQQTGNDAKPNSILHKLTEQRKDVQTNSAVSSSKLETLPTTEQDFKRLLDAEVLRKENLSKEIERLKKNLEERSQNIEKKLGVIGKKLRKL